jgi:hypothetical protein
MSLVASRAPSVLYCRLLFFAARVPAPFVDPPDVREEMMMIASPVVVLLYQRSREQSR